MSALAKLAPVNGPLVEREKFKAEGFVLAKGVIDAGLLESLLYEMDELFVLQLRRLELTATPGGTREALHANARRLLAADVEAYLATTRLTRSLPSALALMISEPILRIARELGLESPVASTEMSSHIASDGLKIPGRRPPRTPRQDWRFRQGSLDAIAFWVPLTPISVRSHPLEVVPRSHLLGLLPTNEHLAIDDPRITEEMFAPLPMQRGDLVVYSAFLVHRISEKGDGALRIALGAGFDNAADPTWARRSNPAPERRAPADPAAAWVPSRADLRAVFPTALD